MSFLSYGGINLQVCRMLPGCERVPLYDGPQYLFTRWRTVCRCLYNPAATSYDFPQVADQFGGGPIAVPNVPAQTDQAIRHRLLIPRQQLILGVGRVAWLVSPQQGFSVDSANGPTPLSCNVIKGPGGRSFVVDYAIETKLRECNLEKTNYPSPFLSHRWEMEHRMDDDFFTTRIIRGHVIFDTARIEQGLVLPDQYRGALFHPIPNNCQRSIPLVKQHPDGNSVEYVIEDEEQQVNIGSLSRALNVTDIDATHSATIGTQGDLKTIAGGLSVLLSLARGGAAAMATGKFLGVKKSSPWRRRLGIAGAVGSGALSGAETLAGLMPLLAHQFDVRVQGNGKATKSELLAVGYDIIASRLNSINLTSPFAVFAGWDSQCVFDLKHRVIEISAKMVTALRGLGRFGLSVRLPDGKKFAAPLIPYIPVRGDVPSVTGVQGDPVAFGTQTYLAPGGGSLQNAPPPGDGVSRGTFLEALTYQALLNPCENQPLPYATDALAVAPVQVVQNPDGVGLPMPFQLSNIDQAVFLPLQGT